MKPIEEGCLAMIIGHPNQNGAVVTVGKFIDRHPNISHVNLWEVDADIQYHYDFITTCFNICPESSLMRIDGEEFEEEEQVEELVLILEN